MVIFHADTSCHRAYEIAKSPCSHQQSWSICIVQASDGSTLMKKELGEMIYEGEHQNLNLKHTEKKNNQNCKDPIQDIIDAGKCCSWCEAYQAW